MITKDDNTNNLDSNRRELKGKIIKSLEGLGFSIINGQVTPPAYPDKDSIRNMYLTERKKFVNQRSTWLEQVEKRALHYFASGNEISPPLVDPRLELVESPLQVDLFRYACLLWSIPVSPGYGRRMRFLVFDNYNDKLIGVFGLSDPVYCLSVRDSWIGWADSQKRKRLWHTMDAYVLGSVLPYSYLLGGKLVALLATSNEVRECFINRYAGKASGILGIVREPHLVLLTTASAMGRSSMLNRLKRQNETFWQSVGMTAGWGHFHLGNGLFSDIADFMRKEQPTKFATYKFGGGPSWKLRIIRSCLQELSIPSDALKHGIKREFFAAPLASNWREYLCTEDIHPAFYDRPAKDLMTYFRERWLLPRSLRDQRYKDITRGDVQRSVRAEARGEN